jgi:hypothetical protein
MERNATTSPLLRLPGEIRNFIYEYVFREDARYNLAAKTFPKEQPTLEDVRDIRLFPVVPHRLALVRTCRQLYIETALLPLQFNTFVFRLHNFRDFGSSQLTLAQRNAIRAIEIRMVAGSKGWLFMSVHGSLWSKTSKEVAIAADDLSFRTLLPGLQNVKIEVVDSLKAAKSRCLGDDQSVRAKENLGD